MSRTNGYAPSGKNPDKPAIEFTLARNSKAIEYAIAAATDLAPARIVAVGRSGALGTQEIHILIEARAGADQAAVRQAAIAACYEACAVVPHNVAVVPSGTIPRTTSGKVRRSEVQKLLDRHQEDTPP